MNIALPKGYKPPEGAKPGEPFEVVATVSLSEDGSFMLKTIDGVEVHGDKDHHEEEEGVQNPFALADLDQQGPQQFS